MLENCGQPGVMRGVGFVSCGGLPTEAVSNLD